MTATIDHNAIRSIFALPKPDGSYEGQLLAYFQSVGRNAQPILLLAFAPKAAGTFFRQAAMDVLGGQLVRASHALGGRDCTPYLPTFLARYLDRKAPPTIMHVHMQAFPANRNFLEAFGLKPVIMIRNIPDMLASFWDMLERDAIARADGLNCLIPGNFVAMTRGEKADFMIDVVSPWYVSYFAGWKDFCEQSPRTVCVLQYEDFCTNPSSALHTAVTHVGFEISRDKCESALARVWKQKENLRFNKGVSGRGAEYFSPAHRARLSRMLAYYPQLTPWLSDLEGSLATVPEDTSLAVA